MTFEDLKVSPQFIRALTTAGITTPTPIQEKAIPPARSGQDIIAIAQTGTGKTAAYLLPLLQVLSHARGMEIRALVLVPTKELAVQVTSHAKMLAINTDLRITGIFGGVGPQHQLQEIAAGIDLLVATPGRFLELYARNGIFTRAIRHVVLDEADRMMDMGFMPQIRSIQEVIPVKRQNLLFSATFPTKVERLAEEFLEFPMRIEVSPESTPVESVEQHLYEVPNFRTKLNLLLWFLEDHERFTRVIVFARTREFAENVSRYLDRKDVGEVRAIHANKGQNTRINAMDDFREGRVRVLVCTDVAARGLDIPAVSHVINLSVPREHIDYVHRIGRTGRASLTGVAITMADPSEIWHIRKIEEIMKMEITRLPMPESVEIAQTLPGEKQEQAREIDTQRKRDDPEFRGAFHERKKKISGKNDKKQGKSAKGRKKKR
jgi:ATP-dependent RNA helicase RhlE